MISLAQQTFLDVKFVLVLFSSICQLLWCRKVDRGMLEKETAMVKVCIKLSQANLLTCILIFILQPKFSKTDEKLLETTRYSGWNTHETTAPLKKKIKQKLSISRWSSQFPLALHELDKPDKCNLPYACFLYYYWALVCQICIVHEHVFQNPQWYCILTGSSYIYF